MADTDVWGDWEEDDDFDQYLIQTSQVVEEEEERRLQQFRSQNGPRGSGGPNMTPNLAAQVFNSRRENLPQERDSEPVQLQMIESIVCVESPSQLQYLNKQYTAEKEKTRQLLDQVLSAQGETCNLRRQVEALRQAQQDELVCRMKREKDDRQRYEEERRELNRKIKGLQTECIVLKNSNDELKAKQAILSRGVGGAQHPLKPFRSQSSSSLATSPAPKPKSDPNLSTSLLQNSIRNGNILQPAGLLQLSKQVQVADRGTQVNTSATEQTIRDEEVFTDFSAAGAEEIRVGNLENIASLQQKDESVRRQIFQTMHQLIKLDFQYNAKEEIESIVARAPKEIMARFTRGVEMKNCFPDLIENMFLYGVQVQQGRDNRAKFKKKYPKLQPALNSSAIDLFQLSMVLESNFVHGSAWLALSEVKKQVQILLSGLVGNMRFRLYEPRNLIALWELLAWTKHLWRFIPFEEEFEEIVQRHGKQKWIKELQAWTGLILKIDWRDFYVPELEKLVREFSLSILETIITTGYFDSSQRRYEILYCILKDTLVKDNLRNEQLLQRCLTIITWSISDSRNIFNYLCINNNDGNCLARILGENVLKCFKELKSYKATTLLLHYFYLLENLMVQHTPRYFSKIVRPPNEIRYEDCVNEEDNIGDAQANTTRTVEAMDESLMCSQFACSEKYKFENGSTDRAKRFNNVSVSSCWINPAEWEVPMTGGLGNGPCQCRKILLGSAFIMLSSVIEWWKESIVKREQDMERHEILEEAELQKLKESFDENVEENESTKEIMSSISKKLESLQTYVIAISSNNQNINDGNTENDDDEILERTRNILLKNWKLSETLSAEECGFEKKHIPITIFDLALRSGILLMNFCNFHSENIALAAGSEAFNCFTQLISDIKMFESLPCITEAEKRSLMEIIRSVEEETEMVRTMDSDTDDEDDDDASCVLLPDEDGVDLNTLLERFPDSNVQKRKFAAMNFDNAFEMLGKEMK